MGNKPSNNTLYDKVAVQMEIVLSNLETLKDKMTKDAYGSQKKEVNELNARLKDFYKLTQINDGIIGRLSVEKAELESILKHKSIKASSETETDQVQDILNKLKEVLLHDFQDKVSMKASYEKQIEFLRTKNTEIENDLRKCENELLKCYKEKDSMKVSNEKETECLRTKNAEIENDFKKCESELLKCYKEKDSMRESYDKKMEALRRKRETDSEDYKMSRKGCSKKTYKQNKSKRQKNVNDDFNCSDRNEGKQFLHCLQRKKYQKETYEMQIEVIKRNMEAYLETKQKEIDGFECVWEKENMQQKYQIQIEGLTKKLEGIQKEIDEYSKKVENLKISNNQIQ